MSDPTKDKIRVKETSIKPGEVKLNLDLTTEQKLMLVDLFGSRGWRIYAQILNSYKDGMLQSLLSMEDSTKIHKTLGLVAGINFAIVQLGVQVSTFRKTSQKEAAKRVAGEPTNPPQS